MIGEKVFTPMLSSREAIMHALQMAPIYVFSLIDRMHLHLFLEVMLCKSYVAPGSYGIECVDSALKNRKSDILICIHIL